MVARTVHASVDESMNTPRRASRHGRWRAASLAAVYVLMGIHIVHWKIAGRTLAPLEINEVLHTLHLGIITAGFIFMTVAVLATSVVGRFFCSWGCHILALEDLSTWLLEKVGIRPKPLRSRVLLWVPPMALAYLVAWPQVERLLLGEALPTLRVVSDPEGWTSFVTTDLWRNLPGPWIAVLTFAVCGFAIVYLLGSRSFCRYVCPYGALFAAADRLAPGRIVAAGDCQKCGTCTALCQSHIRVHEEVLQFGTVVSTSCLKDLDCVKGCPHQALRFGFTRPPLFRSWAELRRRPKRRYSFSRLEDVLMAASFMVALIVFRGLNDSMPFLLALAVAAIFSYIAVLCLRLARDARVRLNNFQLKATGRLTAAGRVFAVVALFLGGLTVHSAFLRYHSFLGQRAFHELARQSGERSAEGLSPARQIVAATALSHLETVDRWDWMRPTSLKRRLASLHLLMSSPAAAEAQLRAVLSEEPDDREARFRLGELLRSEGRTIAAAHQLEEVVASTEGLDSRRDRQLRGAAYAALAHMEATAGRRTQAIRHYEMAVRSSPGDAEALLALGSLLADTGALGDAETYLLRSVRLRPNSAAAHNNLGVVLTRLERDAEAMEHYQTSLRISPSDARVHYNLGMLLYEDGQLDAAVESIERALELRPEYPDAHFGLALALRGGGELGRARLHAQRAAELDDRYALHTGP